jgi:hypothetical protein
MRKNGQDNIVKTVQWLVGGAVLLAAIVSGSTLFMDRTGLSLTPRKPNQPWPSAPVSPPRKPDGVLLPPPPKESLDAVIHLHTAQEVGREELVSGKIQGNVPGNKKLFLYIRVPRIEDAPFYYSPVNVNENNNWTASAIFGSLEDGGKDLSFQTGLVLADPAEIKSAPHNEDGGYRDLVGDVVVKEIEVKRK